MDNPKRIANIMTGRNGSTGPRTADADHRTAPPHLEDRRHHAEGRPCGEQVQIDAVSGITTLWKAVASSMNASPTTIPTNKGNLPAITQEKSAQMAVSPPMYTCRPGRDLGDDITSDVMQQRCGPGGLRAGCRVDRDDGRLTVR